MIKEEHYKKRGEAKSGEKKIDARDSNDTRSIFVRDLEDPATFSDAFILFATKPDHNRQRNRVTNTVASASIAVFANRFRNRAR